MALFGASICTGVSAPTVVPAGNGCTPLPAGAIAWWRAEGNGTDSVGHHNGELLGAQIAPGLVGQAFSFTGSSRVNVADSDDFKLTESLTIEGWINPSEYRPGIIFIRGDNRPGLDAYTISLQPDGTIFFGISNESNEAAYMFSRPVGLGVWTHIAAVLDGSSGQMTLYLNGVQSVTTNTTIRPLRELDGSASIGIGNHGGSFHNFPYHGLMDEWALYGRALSVQEVRGIFEAGAEGKCVEGESSCAPLPSQAVAWWRAEGDGTDTIGQHNGELLGVDVVPGRVGQAFHFTGSSRVNVPDSESFQLTNSLTIECWINPSEFSPGIIFIRGDNRPGLDAYTVSLQPDGTIFFGISNERNEAAYMFSGPVGLGVWTHIAAVLDGSSGQMALYLNGVQSVTTNTTIRPLRELDGSAAIGIGNHGGSFHNFPYHGLIDELALYGRAFSAQEVRRVFDAGAEGKCPQEPPLTRTLRVAAIDPAYEGDEVSVPIELISDGTDVGGIAFVVRYNPELLTDPEIVWGSALAGALTSANLDVPGEVHAVFVLPNTAVPAGVQTIARVVFKVPRLKEDTLAALELDSVDVADPMGEVVTGTEIVSGAVQLLIIPGDNNGNFRVDVGDASLLLRFIVMLDPVQPWDVTRNDLNLSGRLDPGDAIKILKIVSESEPPPALASGGGPGARLRLVVIPDRSNLIPGETVRVKVVLADTPGPVCGVRFALNYSPKALRLLGASSHRLGPDIAPGAFHAWNISPAQSNYSIQDGHVVVAIGSPRTWIAEGKTVAEFTFQVQPGVVEQYLWPIAASAGEITTTGYDLLPLTDGEGTIRGRDPLPARLTGIQRLASGTVQFNIEGDAGLSHGIETSSDLVRWVPLTIIEHSLSTVIAHDAEAGEHSIRFYRVKSE
jgi:hypothetical protein